MLDYIGFGLALSQAGLPGFWITSLFMRGFVYLIALL